MRAIDLLAASAAVVGALAFCQWVPQPRPPVTRYNPAAIRRFADVLFVISLVKDVERMRFRRRESR